MIILRSIDLIGDISGDRGILRRELDLPSVHRVGRGEGTTKSRCRLGPENKRRNMTAVAEHTLDSTTAWIAGLAGILRNNVRCLVERG